MALIAPRSATLRTSAQLPRHAAPVRRSLCVAPVLDWQRPPALAHAAARAAGHGTQGRHSLWALSPIAAAAHWLPIAAACGAWARRRFPSKRRIARHNGEEKASQVVGTGALLTGWAYVLVGVAFAVSLVFTLKSFPLFPFKPQSAAWSFAWLLQTIWDYYATAVCLCGVIIATEGWAVGGLWSLGILLLGSSFSCVYVAMRLLKRGTLAMR
eukprot:CAMPEP_0171074084 /NCGR_PEP_ID=MMETSP0766_2-20121228/11919_1 /TAXON_ID=439317 /ORGANISM="Gambierdiscus australes, Strain CAWD 149" /LENGTH=211 /DNA_ID=CAMNT_0011530839 /DNA_START=76 /DNA_END=711 /DNA_ORIENTATION=+